MRRGDRWARINESEDQIVIHASLHSAISGVPAATLEGALVMLPRANPLPGLARLRSPVWTALLPGSIIVGTFGLLMAPATASMVLVAAAVTTPVLAVAAVLFVTRARPAMVPVAVLAGAMAIVATGMSGHLGTSVITAGLPDGRHRTAAADTRSVAADRIRRHVGGRCHAAGDRLRLPPDDGARCRLEQLQGLRFTGARVGATTIGYPDLFLAALLGASVAGERCQAGAAALLMILATGFDSLLSHGQLLPATVPIAVARPW